MSEADNGLVERWRGIIVGEGKVWVLFRHGTCVILAGSMPEPKAEAIALLREWGPVQVGTPSADFDVIGLRDDPGWVVTCRHPDILTYVGAEEFEGEPDEVLVGLLGRGRRDQDAAELRVIHIEGRRGSP